MKNCTCIGRNAGADLGNTEGAVIIGDDVRDLDPDQGDAIVFPGKLAVGKYVFGTRCNLYDILYQAATTKKQERDHD